MTYKQLLRNWRRKGKEYCTKYLDTCEMTENLNKHLERVTRDIISGQPFALGLYSLFVKPYDIPMLREIRETLIAVIHKHNVWRLTEIQKKLEEALSVAENGVKNETLDSDEHLSLGSRISSIRRLFKDYNWEVEE